jgi:hypothetical protein
MTLSPARVALAAHRTKIIAAGADCEVKRKPVLELQDRIDGEKAALRGDEAAHAVLLAAEDAAVRDCVPTNYVAKIAAASAQVDRRKRAIATLEAKMIEVRRPLDDAELTAGVIASATEPLIGAVIAEAADNALADYFNAKLKLAVAEASVRTLTAFVVGKRWLPLAEKINVTINATPAASWDKQPFPRWDKFAIALATDPNAVAAVA